MEYNTHEMEASTQQNMPEIDRTKPGWGIEEAYYEERKLAIEMGLLKEEEIQELEKEFDHDSILQALCCRPKSFKGAYAYCRQAL